MLDMAPRARTATPNPPDRRRRARVLAATIGTGALLGAGAACTQRPPPPPKGVTAAPAGTPAASPAAALGPGYAESEYYLAGTATSYKEAGTWGADGKWAKTVDKANQAFATRFIVERPADPAKFNGTVWVEWLNVTGGTDAAIDILQARDHITATGAAWVGVSAQTTGVNAIKSANRPRYGALDLSSDALGYDVFRQAGRAVRDHPEILGGRTATKVLAVGDSQSALRLATFANAFPEQDAYDGILVHSRFTSGAPIGNGIMGTTASRIRDDSPKPVFQLQTESEVALNLSAIQPGLGTWADVRQPDAGNVHTWEVTGAAHIDRYALTSTPGADLSGTFALLGCPPLNDFPHHYAQNAAFAALEAWVADGTRPSATPVIETVNGLVQRDADGNAKGGLRLPDIDVPRAAYNAAVGANILCALSGSTTAFTAAQLRTRYGSTAAYVSAYTQKADAAVAAGIMTPADRNAAVAAAGRVVIG
jgi:hypothetical protein